MMHTQGLIDAVLKYYDDTPPTDAQNADHRLRALHHAQEITTELCEREDWAWLVKQDVLSISPGDTTTGLPADFARFGVQGGLYNAATMEWIEERQLMVISRLKAQDVSATLESTMVFAVSGFDATNMWRTIAFCQAGTAMAPDIYYVATAPTLLDVDGTGEDLSGLEGIPVQYHSVILKGTVWRSRRSLSDSRAREFRDDYELAVRQAIHNERQLKAGMQRLPRSAPRMC